MGSRKVLVRLLILPALFLAGAVAAQSATSSAADNIITGLDVHAGQHSTRIVLRGEKTPTFTVFKLKNPDRLVVDLIHTDLKGVDIPTSVEDSHISRIASTQFKQAGSIVSRFIIGLKPDVRFNAKADGPSVVVTISGKDAARQPSTIEPVVTTKSPAVREIAEPLETKIAVVKTVPVKTPAKDFRVVKSHGDRNKVKKVKIKRIKTSDANSITILANHEFDAYQVLEVYAPFRLVLDVYGASMSSKKHERRLSGKHIDKLRAASHADKVRVVIDCAKGKQRPYKIKHLKRGIQIDFTDEAVKAAAAKPFPGKVKKEKTAAKPVEKIAKVTEPAEKKPLAKPKIANLKDIDFRQESTQARVILDLEGDVAPKVTHADNRSTVLEIPYCRIPLILERTLDTSEFGSALQSLSAYRVRGEDKVKLVAVTSSRISSKLVRQGGKLHWVFETAVKNKEVTASTRIEKPGSSVYSYEPNQVAGYSVRRPDLASGSGSGKKKRRRFTGKRISLDFKDADIHNILRLISEVAKLNIITSDDVKGKITITMRNVPWDQALDIILKTKKLGKVRHGNIIRVAPIEELAKEQELAQKAAAAKRTLEPLRVRLIPVNYAVAKDIEKQVKDILSERGTVNVDKRTNVLIIKDILQNLVKAEGLVRSLDTETPQVLIEARVVEANTQFVREVGIQWGGDMSFSETTGNPTGIPFPSSVGITGGASDSGAQNPLSGTATPGHFAINMPAAVGAGSGGALGFIFGSAGGAAHLNLRLSALENRGAVKIISAPKITTLDNQKAKISQGVSIPISVVSAAGVNTQFVEAKLELEVTPHITQEGSVLLQIKVKKNEPDFSRTGARGNPTILKKEAETQVLVRDGDTTVIGGIYTRKTSDTISGIPVLSQIPVLGWFFRKTKKADDRTELLIFITPRIVNRLKATVSQR